MKNIYLLLCCMVFALSSCVSEDFEKQEGDVLEGVPVGINIQLDQGMLTRSGLSNQQEQTINNAVVMVFNSSGLKVSQSDYSSNITSSLHNVPTVSGNNMSVYVVTNLTPQNTNRSIAHYYYDNIRTINDLNQAMLYDLANDLNINRTLVMCGSATSLTIAPNQTTSVTVPLHYVVAKVTLYVVTALTNTSDSYNLTNWTVTNYPQKSFLFPQATDAGTTSVDFANSTTSIAWVDTTLVINGTNTPAKYAFLYMYENRRGTNNNTQQTQKASNAPASATAMVLQGYYKINATNTVKGVNTTIYLGNNNTNDYNVNRGSEYSYIATIKGINKIDVDSRVVSNNYGYQVNVYNTTMDNHPDRRPVQIYSWPGTSTLTITNSDGTTPCTWLRLSSIDLNQAVNNQRVTYNPSTDMVSSMVLTFPATTPSTMASQMVYLYADENPAAGTNTGKRSALLTVVSNEGLPNSQTVTIPIYQYGYQTMGPSAGFRTFTYGGAVNAGSSSDFLLVVENIEEASLSLTPGAAAGTEATTNMQWGFNLSIAEPTSGFSSDYYYRDGYEVSLGLVFLSGGGGPSSVLRPPYGRLSAASAGVASVTITENAMNPIYNTYPARYCFEKNRDVDGDGKITNPNTQGFNEIIWYLPAAEELYGMYVGQYGLSNALTGANYQVSSEVYGSTTSTNSMSYSTGIGGAIGKSQAVNVRCVRRLNKTLPTGVQNSPYIETGSRIVNNQGYSSSMLRSVKVTCPTPINTQNSAVNNALSPRFKVAKADAQLNGASGGYTMTWSQASGWTTASDNSSTTVVASPATGCNAYTEVAGDVGTWRVPTQREMYTIFFMRKELGADGFTALSANSYWTSSVLGATLGWYGVRGNSTLGFGGKTSLMNVRCIRDL